jgi:hypothetical protein
MRIKLLPVVKAYPVIDSVSQTEAVCVAGITMGEPHHWVRLLPLDFEDSSMRVASGSTR